MSQFRIFTPLDSCEVDQYAPIVNGHGSSYVIANGTVSPVNPTSELQECHPDHPDSPGIFRTQSYDAVLFDIRKVSADKLAAQLTLIDLPLFKAIGMEEFCNCNWTKKDKHRLAPNIVAFTQRFNHTSFWVVREILSEESTRLRAEILTKFIKIGKKLLDLNNIHSLKAVVSGLQSTPIYRLTQTWKYVAKKDKSTFERLEDFLSDNDNRKNLREHMDAARLPCIPFLGMYLTDLCFLSEVPNKGCQVETIYNMIAYCQNSTYDGLIEEPHIQKYLNHTRYIDELQKFFEDENYKLSLKYEPDPITLKRAAEIAAKANPSSNNHLRASRSHEDLLEPLGSDSESSHSGNKIWTPQPNHRTLESRHSLIITGGSVFSNGTTHKDRIHISFDESTSKKGSTLPSNFRGAIGPQAPQAPRILLVHSRKHMSESSVRPGDLSFQLESPNEQDPFSPSLAAVSESKKLSSPSLRVKMARGHKKSHSLGSNVLSMLGVVKHSPPQSSRDISPPLPKQTHSRSLIDDSELDNTQTSFGAWTPTGSTGNVSSSDSSERSVDLEDELLEDVDELPADQLRLTLLIEGRLRRKVLKRNGKAVSQLTWGRKCWVQLTPQSLLLLASKPKPTRRTSKQVTVNGVLLNNCRVKYKDPSEKTNDKQFVLVDDKGNQTRFTAKSSMKAQKWVENLRRAIKEEEERERQLVEQSLIKL